MTCYCSNKKIAICVVSKCVDSISMIQLHQMYRFKISTTGIFKVDNIQSWHTPILTKMSKYKTFRYLTLLEFLFLIMLAYQKFANYMPFTCFRLARIDTRLVFVNFVYFPVVVRTIPPKEYQPRQILFVTCVMAQDINLYVLYFCTIFVRCKSFSP